MPEVLFKHEVVYNFRTINDKILSFFNYSVYLQRILLKCRLQATSRLKFLNFRGSPSECIILMKVFALCLPNNRIFGNPVLVSQTMARPQRNKKYTRQTHPQTNICLKIPRKINWTQKFHLQAVRISDIFSPQRECLRMYACLATWVRETVQHFLPHWNAKVQLRT